MATEDKPLFKPLITWPEGTEYLQKVELPSEEPLEIKLARGIHEVFFRHDLEVECELVNDLVESVLKDKA